MTDAQKKLDEWMAAEKRRDYPLAVRLMAEYWYLRYCENSPRL